MIKKQTNRKQSKRYETLGKTKILDQWPRKALLGSCLLTKDKKRNEGKSMDISRESTAHREGKPLRQSKSVESEEHSGAA